MAMARKVALVTGAAQGLGKAFSEVLLKRGTKVCVADIQEKNGQRTVEDFNKEYGTNSSIFLKCDVSKQDDIKATFHEAEKRLGPLDIVVNNAGITDETDWERSLDINLRAVITGSFLAMESMRTDKGGKGGHIINVASMAGLVGVPFAPVYAATKHGVVGFSRSLGDKSWKDLGVKVNCLCPAYADTEIINLTKNKVHLPEVAEAQLKLLGVLKVSTVAEAFEKLLMDDRNGGVLMVSTIKGTTYMRFPME